MLYIGGNTTIVYSMTQIFQFVNVTLLPYCKTIQVIFLYSLIFVPLFTTEANPE